MRVLIIGGTNFIGPAVVASLVAGGHDITLFHRGETEPSEPLDVRHIHGDRERIGEYVAEFRRFAPDVVIDMAAMFERHAVATAAALRGIAARAVCISSIDVYRAYGRLHGSEPGALESMPLNEDSPLREKFYPYRGERSGGRMDDYDKILVERVFMADREIAGTVLRLPAVHGERDYQHRLFMEVARMDARRPSIIVPKSALAWRWPRGYVGNVADAIALVATHEHASGRTYHVAEHATMTQVEWVRAVGRVAGWSGEIVAMPDDMLPKHLRIPNNFAQDLVVDSSRIRRELGYVERVSLDDGIAAAIAWERAHPPENVERMLDYAAEDAALAKLARTGR